MAGGSILLSKKQNGLVANGWIRFVPPTNKLAKQLMQAKPSQKADIYAEAGYWYDAVQALAIARRAQPNDAGLAQAWQALFESETVQLPEIAAQN